MEETEWVETVSNGWNQLAGVETEQILTTFEKNNFLPERQEHYGVGKASFAIVECLLKNFL